LQLSVSFDGRSVTYGFGELDTLVPTYGASILAFFESLVGL
jgi:exodeoxyribonuclease V alpha subunit